MLWLDGSGTLPPLQSCRQPLRPAVLAALLPAGCSALAPLTRLDLSCCELPSQVPACSQLSSLLALHLCECYTWDALPVDGSDSDDEQLALEEQQGISNATLDSLLRQAPHLRELSIEDSLAGQWEMQPAGVLDGCLSSLTKLSLRHNGLAGLPPWPFLSCDFCSGYLHVLAWLGRLLGRSVVLQWLNNQAAQTGWVSQYLPPTAPPHHCAALRDLDLGGNDFELLPAAIAACSALTRLALDGNDDLVRPG